MWRKNPADYCGILFCFSGKKRENDILKMNII